MQIKIDSSALLNSCTDLIAQFSLLNFQSFFRLEFFSAEWKRSKFFPGQSVRVSILSVNCLQASSEAVGNIDKRNVSQQKLFVNRLQLSHLRYSSRYFPWSVSLYSHNPVQTSPSLFPDPGLSPKNCKIVGPDHSMNSFKTYLHFKCFNKHPIINEVFFL